MIPLESPSDSQPTSSIFIRRAEIEDSEIACAAVWKLTQASPTAAQWSEDAFHPYVATHPTSGALQAKALFLACVNPFAGGTSAAGADPSIAMVERIVGFAAFSAILTIGAGESTLENMVVAPGRRRQGIGERLLAAGVLWSRAQGAGMVFLEVRASNRAAIALYERAGFSAVGIRPGYYREPAEDGLQMHKPLGSVASAG